MKLLSPYTVARLKSIKPAKIVWIMVVILIILSTFIAPFISIILNDSDFANVGF